MDKIREYLLSDDNVSEIWKYIYIKCIIDPRSEARCREFIISYFNNAHINSIPNSSDEYQNLVDTLNTDCYNKFIINLQEKYKGKQIFREKKRDVIDNNQNNVQNNVNQNNVNNIDPNIVTKDELDKLIADNRESNNDKILRYLSQPEILNPFIQLVKNLANVPKGYKSCEIIDSDKLIVLLASNKKKYDSDSDSEIDNDSDSESDLDEPVKSKKEEIKSNGIEKLTITEITENNLNEVRKYIRLIENKLPEAKSRSNHSLVKEYEEEVLRVKEMIKQYMEKSKQNAAECNLRTKDNIKKDITDDGIKLRIDPNWNSEWMRQLEITFPTKKIVKKVTLINYILPINNNNITRYNNKLVFMLGAVKRNVLIDVGVYTIEKLIKLINQKTSNALKLELKKGKITISNHNLESFSLQDDICSILPVLGFTNRNYEKSVSYDAENEYNLSNNLVYFVMGNKKIPLTLGKEVNDELVCLEKGSNVPISDIKFSLLTDTGIPYDFTSEIKLTLKID